MWSVAPNQYLGGHMVDNGRLRLLCGLLFVMLLLGCLSAEQRQLLSILKGYQEKKVLIGNLNDTNFEFIDFEKGLKPELSRNPHGEYQRIGMPNAPSQKTTDGRIATCDDKQCTIFDPNSNFTRTLFKSDHVVTPLYWSPDSQLLLFVRNVTKLRLPLRCGWDDEHDVVVYDLSSGKEAIITTVCGGYPYKQLGWYVSEAP